MDLKMSILLLLSLLPLQACANNAFNLNTIPSGIPVQIRNTLNACMSVNPVRQEKLQGYIQQTVNIELHQRIAYCGCTSAQVVVYSDLANTLKNTGQPTLPLAQSPITVFKSGQHTVTLGTAKQLAEKPGLVLGFHCKEPV
jgi:hypothetical protein